MSTSIDYGKLYREHMAEVDARAKEIGWQYVDGRDCPRWMVRKRCKSYGQCWCKNDLNDHGGTWLCVNHWGPHGERFVLWEPYAANGIELAKVIEAATKDGLHVSITASVWRPPNTVGIMFHKPKDYELKKIEKEQAKLKITTKALEDAERDKFLSKWK